MIERKRREIEKKKQDIQEKKKMLSQKKTTPATPSTTSHKIEKPHKKRTSIANENIHNAHTRVSIDGKIVKKRKVNEKKQQLYTRLKEIDQKLEKFNV